jgi:hypothetical protein
MPLYVDNMLRTIVSYVPSILAALVILVVGYIVARIVSSVVRRLLRRTSLDNRLAQELGGSGLRSEGVIASVVFWLIMLFVLVGVFQALELAGISIALGALLAQILAFIPRLLGAAILLVVAWMVATILRRLVSGVLHGMGIDRRLRGMVDDEDAGRREMPTDTLAEPDVTTSGDRPDGISLATTLGDVVYWLVFLLFLPGILNTLDLGGILAPVQVMLAQVFAYLPNIVAAGLILVVGWFVARIVRRIVTGLLAAVGVDRLGERVGLGAALGRQTLSGLLGLLVYIFILVPVLISALDALQIEAVTRPAANMLNTFLAAIPNIFAAAVVLAISYVVGRLVSGLVANLLAGIGFDTIPARLGLTMGGVTVGRRAPSQIVGTLVLVAVMLFATVEALRLLNFVVLADLVAEVIQLGGQILLGLVIFAIGLYLAGLAEDLVRSSGTANAGLLGLLARVAILVLSGAMALRQMGIANEIVNLAFGLLLGAVAVAAAIAFGFGGREIAGRELERWVQDVKARAVTDRGGPPRRPATIGTMPPPSPPTIPDPPPASGSTPPS